MYFREQYLFFILVKNNNKLKSENDKRLKVVFKYHSGFLYITLKNYIQNYDLLNVWLAHSKFYNTVLYSLNHCPEHEVQGFMQSEFVHS